MLLVIIALAVIFSAFLFTLALDVTTFVKWLNTEEMQPAETDDSEKICSNF